MNQCLLEQEGGPHGYSHSLSELDALVKLLLDDSFLTFVSLYCKYVMLAWFGDLLRMLLIVGSEQVTHVVVQEKSYWALALPHGWWLFGLDLALSDDIDICQCRRVPFACSRLREVPCSTRGQPWCSRVPSAVQCTSGSWCNGFRVQGFVGVKPLVQGG